VHYIHQVRAELLEFYYEELARGLDDIQYLLCIIKNGYGKRVAAVSVGVKKRSKQINERFML
jgi:hypothetical protein